MFLKELEMQLIVVDKTLPHNKSAINSPSIQKYRIIVINTQRAKIIGIYLTTAIHSIFQIFIYLFVLLLVDVLA